MKRFSSFLLGAAILPYFSAVGVDAPPPRPVPTKVKVGCYYFPGFFNAARWSPIKVFGKPVPLLGYYRDGLPAVSDWHIKWALENGISYFVFDWYYDHVNGRVSEHNAALDKGSLNAKYRHLMRFAVMWCNEESPDSPPYTVGQMAMLGRNLGPYFRRRNYLRIDGRPVVVISRPARLIRSFGERFRGLIPEISRAAGLTSGRTIFFVALASKPEAILKRMGFAATTAYNYAGHRASNVGSRLRAPYEDMIAAYEQIWQRMTAPGALPYIVPVSPGWDSRPWYGPRAFVRSGSTPAKFRTMCERAKKYVDPRLNMVIAECWNEFGEGSYLEPCREFGFGFLHAVRDVFGVGGPYPEDVVPTREQRAKMTFRTIPPDPRQQSLKQQEGNLLAEPHMEEGTGWVNFDGGPSRFVTATPHRGRRCLEVRPGEGCKSVVPVPAVFQRTYRLSAWVRCSPGARAVIRSALFDAARKWIGRYRPVGVSEATGWRRVQNDLKVTDPSVGALNIEFVARDGTIWVDDAAIVVAEREPPPEVVLADDCSKPERWITYEGKQPAVKSSGPRGAFVLSIPRGQGVKTRRKVPVAPGDLFRVRVTFRCAPMATAIIRSAAFDDKGVWIKGAHLLSEPLSWQDWMETSCVIRVPLDSKARYMNLECYADGGEVLLEGIEVVRGGSM